MPKPQGSLRAFIPRGWRRPILTNANPSVREWRNVIAAVAGDAMQGRPSFEGAVQLTARFFLPRPKALLRRSLPHTKAPDCDKLVRALLDAITGVVYRDDSQVTSIVASKAYAVNDPVGVEVTVEAVETGT